MIVSREQLYKILDLSKLDDGGVTAGQALAVQFGPIGINTRECKEFPILGGGALVLDFTDQGEVASIEIVSG